MSGIPELQDDGTATYPCSWNPFGLLTRSWVPAHPQPASKKVGKNKSTRERVTTGDRRTSRPYAAWHAGPVSTLRDLVEEYTSLAPADIEHLHRLAGDWQLVSD